MEKSKLFQYAIIWHPTKKQMEEEGRKSELLAEPSFALCKDIQTASIMAATNIPLEKKGELNQIEIAVRPF